jgi:hypothetical protein
MTWRIIGKRGGELALARDRAPENCFLSLGDTLAGPFTREAIFGAGYFTAVNMPIAECDVPKQGVTAERYLEVVEQVSVDKEEDSVS